MDYPKFKVCVRCYTYNQSKYITDALNGFVMQETDFPFVCCIVDDASTDGEQDVIKKYVENNFDLSENSCHFERETDYAFITYAQHKTNLNCYFAVLYLKENHYSVKKDKLGYLAEWRDTCEYEALCEGDDYWICSAKLQKQNDYMVRHKECSLCFHNSIVSYEDNNQAYRIFNDLSNEQNITLEQLIHQWIIPTGSILYKMTVHDNYPEWSKLIYSGDLTLSLVAYNKGTIHYLHKVMAVYRRNEGGISKKIENQKRTGFVENEHLKLYTYYNEYTGKKYQNILMPHINKLKMIHAYDKDREKSIYLACIKNPRYIIYYTRNLIFRYLFRHLSIINDKYFKTAIR